MSYELSLPLAFACSNVRASTRRRAQDHAYFFHSARNRISIVDDRRALFAVCHPHCDPETARIARWRAAANISCNRCRSSSVR